MNENDPTMDAADLAAVMNIREHRPAEWVAATAMANKLLTLDDPLELLCEFATRIALSFTAALVEPDRDTQVAKAAIAIDQVVGTMSCLAAITALDRDAVASGRPDDTILGKP